MMEIVGKPIRPVLGITYQLPFLSGHLTLPGFSYLLRDWRHYQMAYSIASIITLPSIFIINESPRWLFATGQIAKSAKILTKAAKINKLPTEGLEEVLQLAYDKKTSGRPVKKGNIIDLLRTRNMRKNTIIVSYNWLACGMSYYGIMQYTTYLGGDIFVNVSISASLGIPAGALCVFLTKYWGRRPTQILANFLTGIAMIIIACLPENREPAIRWSIIVLVTISMVGMTFAFSNIYLYSGEVFPTVVRNAGMGLVSMVSRIGSIVAPFIAIMDQRWLSSLIFGAVPVIAGILCFLLPETKGQQLPDTLEDGENFGKNIK